jgi:NAD(P)H-flavin reductase
MENKFETKPAVITALKDEATDIRLFTLSGKIDFEHGQFVMVGLPGFGEAPFDICSGK